MGKFIKPETDVKSINRNDYRLYVNYGNGDVLFSAGHRRPVFESALDFAARGIPSKAVGPGKDAVAYELYVLHGTDWVLLLTGPEALVAKADRALVGATTKVSCA